MKKSITFTIIFVYLIYFVSTHIYGTAKAQQIDTAEINRIGPFDPLIEKTEKNIKDKTVKIHFTGSDADTRGFRFSIDPLLITYDQFSPTNPIIRENTISFHNTSPVSYYIFAEEDESLRDKSGNFIPDSTCDNGACTEYVAAAWNNTLTYGFGYRCVDIENISCLADFKSDGYFKQFANIGAKENLSVLAKGIADNKANKVKIYYKVNTAASQPESIYSNTITFTALPGY